MLGIPHSSSNFNRRLKTCPENEHFTIQTLHMTNKINELSLETNLKLFFVSKIKNQNFIHLTSILENATNLVS